VIEKDLFRSDIKQEITGNKKTKVGKGERTMKKSLTLIIVALIACAVSGTVFAESATQWYSGYSTADANTVAMFHFDEGAGAITANAYVAGTDGDVQGGSTWIAGRTGLGNALALDGLPGTQVVIPNYAELNIEGSWTVEAWIKHDGAAGGATQGFVICNLYNYHLTYFPEYPVVRGEFMNTTTGGYARAEANSANPVDEWFHAATTWDAATEMHGLYINGSLIAEEWVPGGVPRYWGTNTLFVGSRNGGGYYYNGAVDEVRISNIARTFTPIPEPSMMIGLVAGLMAVLRFKQK
jgi:Concanavalin A-like lectin/glucanases superfamily